jgi:uncharacterized protein YbbK (DUF523 family)/uncharacterized protein YbgA (DUF1722 family)
MSSADDAAIRIGVSACLLGQKVRWDGGHKRDRFLTDTLGRFVEWVPVCPELEVGMGVPRPTLRLARLGGKLRLLEDGSDRDHTRAMRAWTKQRVVALRKLDLCGYVLKRGSPSCGMERVKIHAGGRRPVRKGRGVFAAGLIDSLPCLPVEEEGRLDDPALRENFVERLFAYRRLRDLFGSRWTPGRCVAFHAAHELQLRAHSPEAYQALDRLVAGIRKLPRSEFRQRYEQGFMGALQVRATRGRNANLLQHMAGRFRKQLEPDDREELSTAIHDFRKGRAPMTVPLTLIRHHARRLALESLLGQVYLDPHPGEMMLRNPV